MPYIRRTKITVDSTANILNEDANAIMESWIESGRIIEHGSDVDPDDSDNIITWVKFDSEDDADEYDAELSGVMTLGVDDINFTIVETTNEIVD
jgi:hypothetical protein